VNESAVSLSPFVSRETELKLGGRRFRFESAASAGNKTRGRELSCRTADAGHANESAKRISTVRSFRLWTVAC